MGPMTDFLIARASFLGGAARALDLGNTLTEFNQSLTPQQANATAMRMDWEMVGKALREAMADFEAQVAASDEAESVAEADEAAAG